MQVSSLSNILLKLIRYKMKQKSRLCYPTGWFKVIKKYPPIIAAALSSCRCHGCNRKYGHDLLAGRGSHGIWSCLLLIN